VRCAHVCVRGEIGIEHLRPGVKAAHHTTGCHCIALDGAGDASGHGTAGQASAVHAYHPCVPITDRVLMGPGPSNPYPEVVAALQRPLLGHLDPAFLAVLDETCDRLRQVFQTENGLTFPVSATGSGGMETAFVNFVRPGDVVVVGVNGLFGVRMCEVARRLGAEVVAVEAPWGEPLDPDVVLRAHGSPAMIAVVHAETSTGVRNDIVPLGVGKGDALLVVDMVTSLGGIEVAVDAWHVDVAYSGTQKCLGVPPGLAPLTVTDRARRRIVADPSSWYFDLNLLSRYVEAEGGRLYHHTAPVAMVNALHAGLGAVLDEGLEAAWARHEACGGLLQDGLESMGLRLVAPSGHRLPQLTTVWVPDDLPAGADEAAVRRSLLMDYGIEIGAGVGPQAGLVWRIGCMGHTARRRNVTLLLAALGEVLGR
jgi:alanine-glyoxylate transaminase / serine-glyoxylate transaminase / serine-pyruvate transaminase